MGVWDVGLRTLGMIRQLIMDGKFMRSKRLRVSAELWLHNFGAINKNLSLIQLKYSIFCQKIRNKNY